MTKFGKEPIIKHYKDKIALALDNNKDFASIEKLIDETSQFVGIYKVGFEQFIRFGDKLFEPIRKNNAKIFLDMKLHDIPNTVAQAVSSAIYHGVDFLTIHAIGGKAMMTAAVESAKKSQNAPKIIGVTILTSIDKTAMNDEMRINGEVEEQVARLTKLAAQCGLDGIVCSALELPVVKAVVPDNFEIITPGIRPAGVDSQDQKRVATPQSAIENGATILVIGRAITSAQNPSLAAKEILESISKN
ncbi:MAG: orotidine-5'-phosphate decarboxylase [Chitinispirillales bacterium]|nr:orotidine-5'-phosphate decarboxylase [Chitinispirillales bacterium]